MPVFSVTGIILNQEGDAFGVHFMNGFLDLIGFDVDPKLWRTSNRLPETGWIMVCKLSCRTTVVILTMRRHRVVFYRLYRQLRNA